MGFAGNLNGGSGGRKLGTTLAPRRRLHGSGFEPSRYRATAFFDVVAWWSKESSLLL
ncbi:hypothetical protein LA76x_0471 [Lysobacter antibioticus]|uniref:Uncharacterized protein n=1 Tax=Lysobacter antibioticus TaxID=84531 RepID=A0A0S2F520_LYSAN|nr:hypothetical protein LA76x_0471 [Lysobacter antibioticus]